MDNIHIIEQKSQAGKWLFEVEIVNDGSSRHLVTMDSDYYSQLTSEKLTPGEFVLKCFTFLLKHEPKESILKSFDIRDISKYFPEFEETIKN